ncbi:hypothetical protein [Streptomyces sp. NPDC089799]|uniref:hypothetical protein n=1 Tax=Streptomyces sp. NPDC089799 TaxID=3155066 RepID=UPI003422C6D9
MSEIVVLYELDPTAPGHGAGHAPGQAPPQQTEPPVVLVHAAPTAPDQPELSGPRTFCGRDTFAMLRSRWVPAAEPGTAWYPPEYADLACPACEDAVGG